MNKYINNIELKNLILPLVCAVMCVDVLVIVQTVFECIFFSCCC